MSANSESQPQAAAATSSTEQPAVATVVNSADDNGKQAPIKTDESAAKPAIAQDATHGPAAIREMTDQCKAILRIAVDDALIVVSSHLHNVVLVDSAFRESVIRYLFKTNKHKYRAAVFHQKYHEAFWHPIKEHGADEKQSQMLWPRAATIATKLVVDKHESIMLVIDYVDPTTRMFNLRFVTVLSLFRGPNGRVQPTGVTAKDWIKMQVDNTVLIEQRMEYDVNNLINWKLEEQHFAKTVLNECLDRRTKVANAYADTLFWRDIREACVLWNIHKKIMNEDDNAIAAGTKLSPTKCFRISCGGKGTAKAEMLTQEQLTAVVETSQKAGIPEPMTDSYVDVLDKMSKPREKYEAVVLVIRSHDGPISTTSSVMRAVVNMQIVGDDAELERKSREEYNKSMQQEIAELMK